MPEVEASALIADESRFSGDGADLNLLHWLRHAEQAIETLPNEILRANIQSLHAFFLKVLLPPTPNHTLPRPGRPIRHLISRSLIKLHKKVESRSLFDFVQALVKGVGDGGGKSMSVGENVARVACWYCIGEIIREMGANMMSFMAEICTSSMKVLKNSNLSIILRTHAVLAFSKSLQSAGRALPDSLVKDLLKNLRAGMSDRALPIQRACAETFVSLHIYTTACPLLPTLDSIAPLVLKSLEGGDYLTRRSLSRMLATLLAATQVPGSGNIVADPGKKVVKKDVGEEGLNEPTIVTSATEDRGSKTLLSLQEMFKYLSLPYNRPNSPRKLRNAILDIYSTLLTSLGAGYVENHYGEIIKHLIEEIVMPSRSQATRYEVLSTRESVGLLLRDLIGVRLLSEGGQIVAIREWTNEYIKKWQTQPLPGQIKPNKHVLIIALREVAGLLEQLGNAPPSIIELLAEPIVRLLSHDSYSVRLAAAYTLRRFCALNPSQLPRMLDMLIADVTKDLGILGTPTAARELPDRVIGKALALSALIAISPSRPLYVNHDISSKVFDLAVSLLKKSGDHEIPSAVIEVQVAWYLIAALMSLGGGFTRHHLPQLLVLWRNALPKPTSKDASVGERGEADWSFLLLVRECTLSAILNFLRHNQPLVNIDVARRLATLLTNTLNFINGFATAYSEALKEQSANPNTPSGTSMFTTRPSLVERESNLRRRILQCFTALGPTSATESMQPALLQASITVFADPENYSGSSAAAQVAISASAGNFGGIWEGVDGYAFGVGSGIGVKGLIGEEEEEGVLNRDRVEMAFEALLTRPIIGSIEHDFLTLLPSHPIPVPPSPAPPATGVIDAGIELFATMFPHQNAEGQIQSLATLSSHVRSSKLERNPGRKMAVVANTVAALRKALVGGEGRLRKGLGGQVEEMIRSLLQDAVLDSSPNIRQIAAEAMGLLSGLAGSNYLSTQVQWLVDQVVNNRVPESRAGCALAFGAIYANVGGLAGGPILKTIINILMSLATDPHPVVHFYAMTALAQVINAASLSYSPYIPTTLGMLANIYLLDTHEPDGGSLGSVNMRGDLPAYQAICRILHALVGVLGPELQEPGKIRSLVFLLVHEFGEETDEGLAVEAIKCIQQFLMFAPAEVDIPKLLSTFRSHLASTRRPLKVATITALYQIVQRDAIQITKLGGNQLVEDLFGLLDDDPSLEGVRNVITSWLSQTAAALPGGWIDLCQRIMTRTAAQKRAAERPKQSIQTATGFNDDEGESFAGGVGSTSSNALSSRWRTQLFALSCLHGIVLAVAEGGGNQDFDPVLAGRLGLNARGLLFSRVADLIRMAFSASAAGVVEIRLAGLVVLRDVIERFATSADPDFEGSLLLEQHQAPIAAALTPSFGSDSSPEVLASAVQVCAVFVGSGVVKEVSRMGRILKLLTGALEQCKDGAMLSLGDVEDLGSNASVMLKISILAAWAELQVASVRQAYLVDVIKPYRWLLGPFWVGVLRDWAGLRTDPEMGAGTGGIGEGLGRDVLLPFYERSTPKIMHALAISLSASDPYALGALDGQSFSASTSPIPTNLSATRTEPVANFYIIYGLAFEAMLKSLGDSSNTATLMAQVCLKVLGTLVRPSVCGGVFESQVQVFDEFAAVGYRVGMGEGAVVRAEVCEVLRGFVESRKGVMGYDAAQTRRCLAIITFIIRSSISSRDQASTLPASDSAADRIALIKSSFTAYTAIVETMEAQQRADLCAVALHLFGEVLADETSGYDVAGGSLGVLKGLLDLALGAKVQVPGIQASSERIIHGLLSACLGNVDDMRTRINPTANIKIKNNLLALTLILTSLSPNTRVSKPLVEQMASTIGQYLGAASERPELGLTAVHCTSTILLASLRTLPTNPPTTSAVLGHTTLHLISAMVGYLADSVVADTPPIDGVREVVKALSTWCNGLKEDTKSRGYAVLLPTLCLLLDPEGGNRGTTGLHNVATGMMLALAQGSSGAFKDATTRMDSGERGRLERAVREAVGGQGKSSRQIGGDDDRRGGIELRSFG